MKLNIEDFKGPPTMPSDDVIYEGKNHWLLKTLYELRIKFNSRDEFMKHVNAKIVEDGTRFKDGHIDL